MDLILKRVRMAEGQVLRRCSRRKLKKQRREKKKEQEKRESYRLEAAHQRHLAIKARHDRWDMGPLAPNWDTLEPKSSQHGAVSAQRARLRFVLDKEEKDKVAAWAGGATNLCLREGDRVVVIEGHYKNIIGVVSKIDMDNMAVNLADNVLKVNMSIEDARVYGLDKSSQENTASVPISAVRLVHPLPDGRGKLRDVVIREFRPVKVRYDRPSRTKIFSRRVPGLNVRIPWPPASPGKRIAHKGDTKAIDVDRRTFVPILLRPPFPAQVLDELRNKYSKYRVRHTPEFIAQMEAKVNAERAVKDAKKRTPEAMRTALQEFTLHQRKLRKALGPPVLTEEMLAKIGEVIAWNKNMKTSSRRGLDVGDAGAGAGGEEGGDSKAGAVSSDAPSPPSQNLPVVSSPPKEEALGDARIGDLQKAVEQLSIQEDSTTPREAPGQRLLP